MQRYGKPWIPKRRGRVKTSGRAEFVLTLDREMVIAFIPQEFVHRPMCCMQRGLLSGPQVSIVAHKQDEMSCSKLLSIIAIVWLR